VSSLATLCVCAIVRRAAPDEKVTVPLSAAIVFTIALVMSSWKHFVEDLCRAGWVKQIESHFPRKHV